MSRPIEPAEGFLWGIKANVRHGLDCELEWDSEAILAAIQDRDAAHEAKGAAEAIDQMHQFCVDSRALCSPDAAKVIDYVVEQLAKLRRELEGA